MLMVILVCALASVGTDIVGTQRPTASASDRNNDLGKASSLYRACSDARHSLIPANCTTVAVAAIAAKADIMRDWVFNFC
ncbi:ABC-type uncharacterized transport system substrate-binding protein [Rhizobium sp. BK176]|nr:ABC-type uncharacterized transport system substrate-binding protein [Rhizobium sp. BK661]MCS4090533.1 ABC-type uncharacterized transport system substrate-binding protein [Rhizobium sp. BK176]